MKFAEASSGNKSNSERLQYSLPRSIKERESPLLMYYLDCVFPVQFRMYSPSINDGGRGWFLSLLLRTPPLYHATLAISALCLESWTFPTNSHCKQETFAQLGLALQDLQQYIYTVSNGDGKGSLEDNIKACAGILQMFALVVSFY